MQSFDLAFETRMDQRQLSMKEGNTLDDKIDRWVQWCKTRRLFSPPLRTNVLARLQPRRIRLAEPDSFLDSEMPFFNAAIQSLCDRPDFTGEAECFVGVYWYRVNIKRLAADQSCSRGTVYNRARRFAQRAYALSISLRQMQTHIVLNECSRNLEHKSCGIS